MGLGRTTRGSIIHTGLHKPNNKLVSAKLKHFWCMDEPWANTDWQDLPHLGLGGSHHLPPYSILCAWPWGQHSNVILSQYFQVGVLKFSKLGLMWLWRHITLCEDLRLRWGLKQSCNPCPKLSNRISHTTYTQGYQGDSQLLMVDNQIRVLTSDPFFCHNLCFMYPNGSWKTIF
jgi:hypothetical protein